MFKNIAVLLLIILFCSPALAQQNKYDKLTIEEILEWPDEKIDIGFSSLILAKEFYPELKVEFFLYSFAYMAQRFQDYFGELKTRDERIRALNTYIYKPGPWNDGITFNYDDDDLQAKKLSNKFINGYIATKQSSCITMPLLYVILGERLGWPIYPVRSAKHFFVRYLNDELLSNFQANIEATSGGSFISDEQYQKDVLIPDKAIENGVYLRTLTKKQYLASLLLTNANEHFVNGNFEKARHYFQLSIKYDPTFSSAYWNYGWIHFEKARKLEEKLNAEVKAVDAYYFAMQNNRANAWDKGSVVPKSQKPYDALSQYLPPIPKPAQFKQPDIVGLGTQGHATTLPQTRRQPQRPAVVPIGLRQEIADLEERYIPQILASIEIYKQYKTKADELGIVKKYPLEFFQKQAESIKRFKEKGGY